MEGQTAEINPPTMAPSTPTKISPQDQEAAESETMMMNAVFFAIFTKASDFG
jgi:hypothetical protein